MMFMQILSVPKSNEEYTRKPAFFNNNNGSVNENIYALFDVHHYIQREYRLGNSDQYARES